MPGESLSGPLRRTLGEVLDALASAGARGDPGTLACAGEDVPSDPRMRLVGGMAVPFTAMRSRVGVPARRDDNAPPCAVHGTGKAPKRAKNRGAPVPHVEDGLSRLWQLTLDAYAAAGIAVGPMRRDIVRVIRTRRRRKP